MSHHPSRLPAAFTAAAVAIVLALAAADRAPAVVTSSSTITTIAGDGSRAFGGDGGPASGALLNEPRDTAIGPDGSIYVADTFNNRIRRIAPNGTISTFAGNGSHVYNGDNIPAKDASLAWPHDLCVTPNGVVFIADSNHHRIRRVGLNGIITTVAGTGVSGSSGNGGPATRARLKNPKSVVSYGRYLYTSGLDNEVRRIDRSTGIITRVAGTGTAGHAGDGGPARRAELNSPQRIQVDSLGNIYIADTLNDAVRRVDAKTGKISTIAGTLGEKGLRGDGGPATAALLADPRGIALDGDKTLYVADTNNQRVRVINLTTGIIRRVAGTKRGYAGDGGPAGSAQLYQPRGLSVTPGGDLLIADTLNSVLREVAA